MSYTTFLTQYVAVDGRVVAVEVEYDADALRAFAAEAARNKSGVARSGPFRVRVDKGMSATLTETARRTLREHQP